MARYSAQAQSAQGPTAAANSPTPVALVGVRLRLLPMSRIVLLSGDGMEKVVAVCVSRRDGRAGWWEMCQMMKRLVLWPAVSVLAKSRGGVGVLRAF